MKKIKLKKRLIFYYLLLIAQVIDAQAQDSVFSRCYKGTMNYKSVDVFLSKNMQSEQCLWVFCYFEDGTAPQFFVGGKNLDDTTFKYVLYEAEGLKTAAKLELNDISGDIITGLFSDENSKGSLLKWVAQKKYGSMGKTFLAQLTYEYEKNQTSTTFDLGLDIPIYHPSILKRSPKVDSILKEYLKQTAPFRFTTFGGSPLSETTFREIASLARDSMMDYIKHFSRTELRHFFIQTWANDNWLILAHVKYFEYTDRNFGFEVIPLNIRRRDMTLFQKETLFEKEKWKSLASLIKQNLLANYDNNWFNDSEIYDDLLYERFLLTKNGIIFIIQSISNKGGTPAHVFISYKDLKPYLRDEFKMIQQHWR